MQLEFRAIRWAVAFLGVVLGCSGCASTRLTDTSRSGMEQLLISSAIDSSLDKVDFECLAGASVFLDERFLDCTDKKYVVGSIRQRIFRVGCRLVDKADEADIVVELYSGAVGTDRSEGFIGTPAVSLPGPVPFQLPEVKLLSQTSQYGTAKIGIVAYDAKTRQALSAGALSRARSENSNWTILGFLPYNSGTLRDEVALTRRLKAAEQRTLLSNRPSPLQQNQISTFSPRTPHVTWPNESLAASAQPPSPSSIPPGGPPWATGVVYPLPDTPAIRQ